MLLLWKQRGSIGFASLKNKIWFQKGWKSILLAKKMRITWWELKDFSLVQSLKNSIFIATHDLIPEFNEMPGIKDEKDYENLGISRTALIWLKQSDVFLGFIVWINFLIIDKKFILVPDYELKSGSIFRWRLSLLSLKMCRNKGLLNPSFDVTTFSFLQQTTIFIISDFMKILMTSGS